MAYIDVKQYYLELESQYIDLLKFLKQLEREYKDGKVSYEKVEEIKGGIEDLRENYERIAYIMHLFSIPKSKKNRKKMDNDKILDSWFEHVGADKKAVLDENTNVLVGLKKLIEEGEKEECQTKK